jgi:exosortase K
MGSANRGRNHELRAFSARTIQRHYLGRWPRLLHSAPLALRPMFIARFMNHVLRSLLPRDIFDRHARSLFTPKRLAQLIVVLLCALTLKQYYSTANVNELRWILAPTTALVELVSGSRFEFESYAGYINSDRSFMIAASCAGVNFLLTAFLMLSLAKLLRDRSQNIPWRFIPVAAVCAYLATLVANTVRIATALRLRGMSAGIGWLDPNQVHRIEGILIYFGFLLLLFLVSEKMNNRTIGGFGSLTGQSSCARDSDGMPLLDYRTRSTADKASFRSRNRSSLWRQSLPLLIYYATTLGIPLANAVYRPGVLATDFWHHLLFVLLTPLILILPIAAFRCYRDQRESGLN